MEALISNFRGIFSVFISGWLRISDIICNFAVAMDGYKIINDPVFGFIKIRKGLIYNVVQHPLFQRLNRINQLGLASSV